MACRTVTPKLFHIMGAVYGRLSPLKMVTRSCNPRSREEGEEVDRSDYSTPCTQMDGPVGPHC